MLRKMSQMEKEMSRKISQVEKALHLSRAWDHLAQMTAQVYHQISFVYDGHNVNNYNDLCNSRHILRTREGLDLGLESAVAQWAADFLEEPPTSSENLGHAFFMYCKLKAARNSAIRHMPNLMDVPDLTCLLPNREHPLSWAYDESHYFLPLST